MGKIAEMFRKKKKENLAELVEDTGNASVELVENIDNQQNTEGQQGVGEQQDTENAKPKKKRKSIGKRVLKIFLIVLAALFALVFLLLVFISPIAHRYIEKHSKELVGRVVTMEDLKINVFKGTAEIDGFVGLEQNDRDTFVTFDRLYGDITLWDLLKKKVRLNEITLNTPKVTVVQYPGRFNFTDIIEHFTDDDDDDDEPSGWTVDLRNITITDGNAIYRDAAVGSVFDLRQLAIHVPQIYFSTEQTDVGLDLQFANGGGLNVKLLYGMEDSEYDLSVKLKDFELQSITPYLKQYFKIQNFNGLLTADVNLKGNMSHILDVVAKGKVKVSKLSATDLNDQKLATVDFVEMDVAEADTKTGNYHLNKFEVSGADFDYEIFKDHSSFDDLFVNDDSAADEEADTAKQESSSLHLLVDELALTNTSFHYKDHTMHELVDIPFSQVDVRSSNFDLDKPFSVKVSATVAETGQLHADWSGSLSDFSNMKLNAFISNFKLTAASPYCVEYMAYPITDGVLSLASTSTLVNNNINSQNKIDIYNCKVDKKIKDMETEFNIPLRAGVYILTDRKGNIQLDLPVSGNIDDPTFSYKKIIFKTLCNLFVKVVASPVDFLVKAIGGEPDLFADIAYDIHPQGLGSEASDKLNKIADALKEKPEITLVIQQSLNMEENMQEYALFSAKRDFYMRNRQGQQPTMADFEAIQEIKKTDKAFIDYVNGRAGESVQGDIYAKCLSLYDQNIIKQQIDANVERRNQKIINQLTSQGIARNRLELLPLGNKKTPKGKTLVSFDVKVADE